MTPDGFIFTVTTNSLASSNAIWLPPLGSIGSISVGSSVGFASVGTFAGLGGALGLGGLAGLGFMGGVGAVGPVAANSGAPPVASQPVTQPLDAGSEEAASDLAEKGNSDAVDSLLGRLGDTATMASLAVEAAARNPAYAASADRLGAAGRKAGMLGVGVNAAQTVGRFQRGEGLSAFESAVDTGLGATVLILSRAHPTGAAVTAGGWLMVRGFGGIVTGTGYVTGALIEAGPNGPLR